MKTQLPPLLILLWLVLSVAATATQAQTVYTVTGLVTDAHTGDPIPFASVSLVGRRSGALTDEKGRYTLVAKILTDSIAVSSMGYKVSRQAIDPERTTQAVDIKLESGGNALQEVTVKAGENPAWRVLRQLRKNRSINDRKRLSAYEYDSYVKTEIALSHVSDRMRKNPLIKRINEAMSKHDSIIDK
ncbi:MAG: carboxypeptidase-like regulatory domain-containing protein, partial [Pedobacter sp.]